MRRRVIGAVNTIANRSNMDQEEEDPDEPVEKSKERLMRKLVPFFSSVRGTEPYWRSKRGGIFGIKILF